MKNLFQTIKKSKVSSIYFGISIALLVLLTSAWIVDEKKNHARISELETESAKSCKLKIVRKNNQEGLAKPFIMSDMETESMCLSGIKQNAEICIDKSKENNTITNASIYMRSLQTGEWFTINDELGYQPGSLFKLPVLMTYMKLSESNPSLLSTQITFDNTKAMIPNQSFGVASKVKSGGTYSVQFLLEEMAINSDNNATFLLNSMLDKIALNKMLTDLEIPNTSMQDMNYTIKASDYSKFFRVLFNCTYLNEKNSNYVLNILTKSPFKSGITKNLPGDVKCSHKFGEYSNGNGVTQLHESGIVYILNHPYIITILSRGNDKMKLPNFISELSQSVYNNINS